jgi:hypothetical protein
MNAGPHYPLPHHDLWAGTPASRAARDLLFRALARRPLGATAIVATPDRGNVHGPVSFDGYGVDLRVAGIPVRGFQWPYANGCTVFTHDAPQETT